MHLLRGEDNCNGNLINFLDAPRKKNVITSNIVIMTCNNQQFVDTAVQFRGNLLMVPFNNSEKRI